MWCCEPEYDKSCPKHNSSNCEGSLTFVFIYPLQKRAQQRRRIDRSMIGEPTNFRHTGHVGSGDVEMGNNRLRDIQRQMQGKGGYETGLSVKVN